MEQMYVNPAEEMEYISYQQNNKSLVSKSTILFLLIVFLCFKMEASEPRGEVSCLISISKGYTLLGVVMIFMV